MNGIERIALERKRQLEQEGWSAEHDAQYTDGELLKASMCYALGHGQCHDPAEPPHPWPWDASWWKPSPDDRIRELEKAGALIAAEIDRLQALEGETQRFCIISDGDSRQYLCPVERRDEGAQMLGAVVEYWEEGGNGPVPPMPEFIRAIEGTHRLTFCLPEDGP